MVNTGGDHRRLVPEEKKVWRPLVPRISNNITEQQWMEMGRKLLDMNMMRQDNHIPNDIVVEILLRLPAKSLVRLRWACKYWFDLITRDNSFVKMHLHSSTTTTIDHDIFSIISHSVLSTGHGIRDCNKIYQCYLRYNNCATRVEGVDVSSEVTITDLPLYYPLGYHPTIMGSCNGLILLHEPLNDSLCIWNPCTKEYRILPHPLYVQEEVPEDSTCEVEGYCYGFGYDHTIDDYKIIRNTNCYHALRVAIYVGLRSYAQVYTLGTNIWRWIGPNPYRLRTHQLTQGVFLNGALYWMDYSGENIISFDFGTEEFQHVSKTPNLNDEQCGYVKIQVFEGSLCVELIMKDQQKYYRAEIWVMKKDYAVNNKNKSLWTKLSTILFRDQFQLDLLRYTRNGDILMLKNMSELVLYDHKNNNAITLCEIGGVYTNYHFVQEVYTESLVSLNSGTYKGQEQRKEQQQQQQQQQRDAMMVWRNSLF